MTYISYQFYIDILLFLIFSNNILKTILIVNSVNISNTSNTSIPTNDTFIEVEIIQSEFSSSLNTLTYQLTPEQKYKLQNYADPNREIIEEFVQELPNENIAKEQIALREFYHATNGIYWLNNWDFTVKNTSTDILANTAEEAQQTSFYFTLCNEYGITCESNGYVTNVSLAGNNLTGIIPPIISNLTNVLLYFPFPNFVQSIIC